MTIAVDMIREDLISGRRQSAVHGTFEMVAVNEFGRPVPIIRSDNQSNQRGSCVLKQHSVRTFKSADHLARTDQLAWKIAAVAADPARSRSTSPKWSATASSTTPPLPLASSTARRWRVRGRRRWRIRLSRRATVFGLARAQRVSPEWAAWANGVAVRELDFHDTFLAADYSHPGDNIPPLLAVAQQCGRQRRRSRSRHRRRLRDPGRSGQGHLPARAQDRPHRASRPVRRGRHRHAARACRPRRSTRPCSRPPRHHHDAAIAQGRDLAAGKPTRPPSRARWRSKPSTAPCAAKARRHRSTKARTVSLPGCSGGPKRNIRCRCPKRASRSVPSSTPTPRSTRQNIRARR